MQGSSSFGGAGYINGIVSLLNPIRKMILFSILLLLLLIPTISSIADNYAIENGTRGVISYLRLYCNDYNRSIQPGENITYEITIEITMYEGPLNGSIWVEELPQQWDASLNMTNFTVEEGDDILYATLFISSSTDALIGVDTEIRVSGILANESGEINNSGHTMATLINIIGPDLSLMPTGITLSNEEPIYGETVTFSAQVYNYGEVDATDVPVILMVDDVQIGSVLILPLVESGSSENISAELAAPIPGDYEITILIDPDNSINEHSEENNNETITLSVARIPEDNGGDDDSSWPFVRMVIAIMMVIAIALILIFLRVKKKKDPAR